MTSINKGFISLCIPLLTLLMFAGCEDPGSVGGDFVDKSELTFDTLLISNTEPAAFSAYSGRLNFITMGKLADPVFGDIDAIALIKPTLSASIPEDNTINEDYRLELELVIDSVNTYGDTLSEANYSVYEVTSQWVGSTFKIDSELTYDINNPVGSFTIGTNDTITVNLNEWKDTFADFYHRDAADPDSVFRYEFKGLALVADDGSDKISFPTVNSSTFLAINEADPDTTFFSVRDWAYSLNRVNENIPGNVNTLHSTLEGMLKTNLTDYIDEFEGKNFIRAELIFQEATEVLQENLPENYNRLSINNIDMDLGYEDDPAYEFQFEAPDGRSEVKGSDNSYRINITRYFNDVIYGSEDKKEIYISSIGSSTGALRSTLIYNETAAEDLRPKLIITSLTDDEE